MAGRKPAQPAGPSAKRDPSRAATNGARLVDELTRAVALGRAFLAPSSKKPAMRRPASSGVRPSFGSQR